LFPRRALPKKGSSPTSEDRRELKKLNENWVKKGALYVVEPNDLVKKAL